MLHLDPEQDTSTDAADLAATGERNNADDGNLIEDELLVEEISIDGMCGVY